MNTERNKIRSPELLFSRAQKMGLHPVWLTPNNLFVVNTSNGERYINHEHSSLNSHISTTLARNKYHTRLILQRHGLPNIPFALPKTTEEAEAFLEKHKTIIVKPVRGTGANNIHVVSNSDELAELDITKCIFEKYLPGKEMRYLVLNGSVIAVHESKYGSCVEKHRKLERISYDKDVWDPDLVEMSVKISEILDLAFATVDFIIDGEGKSRILEVNTRPGFKWFHSPSQGPAVDVAQLFLDAMLSNAETR